jgi:flagellar M-ring protein FliF
LMLRSMIRSPGKAAVAQVEDASEPAGPRLAAIDGASDEDEPETTRLLNRHFKSSGPDLRTELQEIVKDNPDAAATILRAWIGEAA